MQQASTRRLRAVFFDVGETLVDESREYGSWADWLGVPRHTFSAVFGAAIDRGEDYRQVFQHFRPGFDLKEERQRRLEAGLGEHFNGRDLYPDARECLAALKQRGLFVGIAGNQTSRAGGLIRELHLPADLIATSDDWGVEKPSPEFFQKLVRATDLKPNEIAYVGDRLENDILPARQTGLVTVLIRRGPWAHINDQHPDVGKADLRVDSLAELPEAIDQLNALRAAIH